MARYDNERPPYIPNPQADPAPAPKPEEKQEEKNESSFGGGGGYGGGSMTVVPRREWLPKYHFNGGEKPPPHYRHEDYGHEKEHRITGINPAEVLDKVQSTLGMTVPKIPSDIVKESSGEKV